MQVRVVVVVCVPDVSVCTCCFCCVVPVAWCCRSLLSVSGGGVVQVRVVVVADVCVVIVSLCT